MSLLKSSRLELINITTVTPTNGTGFDFSLIGLIDLLCTGEEIKVVELFLLKLPDYESYISLPRLNGHIKTCNSLKFGCPCILKSV
jgi:hypothetical protein